MASPIRRMPTTLSDFLRAEDTVCILPSLPGASGLRLVPEELKLKTDPADPFPQFLAGENRTWCSPLRPVRQKPGSTGLRNRSGSASESIVRKCPMDEPEASCIWTVTPEDYRREWFFLSFLQGPERMEGFGRLQKRDCGQRNGQEANGPARFRNGRKRAGAKKNAGKDAGFWPVARR